MKPYIYKITHPSGFFYIGSRWANKICYQEDFGKIYFTSTENELVTNEFHSFTRSFIECETRDEVRELEKKMIREEWGNPFLLNRSIPGEKFYCDGHSEKTRQKMSESKRGKRPNNFGKPASAEACLKMSEKAKLQKHSEERKQKASARMIGNTAGLGNKSRTGQTQSAEERKKKSIALAGRDGWKPTQEQKEASSKAAANRPRFCCRECKIEMQINSFTRHMRLHNIE